MPQDIFGRGAAPTQPSFGPAPRPVDPGKTPTAPGGGRQGTDGAGAIIGLFAQVIGDKLMNQGKNDVEAPTNLFDTWQAREGHGTALNSLKALIDRDGRLPPQHTNLQLTDVDRSTEAGIAGVQDLMGRLGLTNSGLSAALQTATQHGGAMNRTRTIAAEQQAQTDRHARNLQLMAQLLGLSNADNMNTQNLSLQAQLANQQQGNTEQSAFLQSLSLAPELFKGGGSSGSSGNAAQSTLDQSGWGRTWA